MPRSFSSNSKWFSSAFAFLLVVTHLPGVVQAKEQKILENFNRRLSPQEDESGGVYFENPEGHRFGAWNKDPKDISQGCQIELSEQDAVGSGGSIELTYDVDSPFPAFNGFYLKLNGADLTLYDTLEIHLKRKAGEGMTTGVKLEFKNAHTEHERIKKEKKLDHSPYLPNFTSAVYLDAISDRWQKLSIPFSEFKRIRDWSDMHELVIIFDDVKTQPKAGILYMDQIVVSKK